MLYSRDVYIEKQNISNKSKLTLKNLSYVINLILISFFNLIIICINSTRNKKRNICQILFPNVLNNSIVFVK